LSIDQFLNLYHEIERVDLDKILRLDFDLDYSVLERYVNSERICPLIEIAKPEEAEEISQIFREVYQGTYPYKKMEYTESIAEMIKDPNYYWFLFKLNTGKIVGAFGAHLEFKEKRGLLYGFVIRKGYHKVIDIFKAFIGCAIYLWKKYHKIILMWYGEMRTNETSSQFFTSIVGMKPVAFYPNKDLFYNKKESDILHIIYDREMLRSLRSKQQPKIIRQALMPYTYINQRFQLGLPIIINPKISLNHNKIKTIQKNILLTFQNEEYGNKWFELSNKKSNSYFKFLYNPHSKNFEKTEYSIETLEELQAFLNYLKKLIIEMKINYFECFVSAYKVKHQKLFYDLGFKPRGYIPSFIKSKSENCFEDCIVFNYYRGKIDKNIKIIPEVADLLKSINFFEQEYLKTL